MTQQIIVEHRLCKEACLSYGVTILNATPRHIK